MTSHSRLQILLIELEFPLWRQARHWSYANQAGIEEGLRANGVEYLTLTTPWLSRAQEICKGKHFDQVWMEIVHHDLDGTFLEWVANLAPVRIGLIAESLKYYPEEYAVFSGLKERRHEVERRLKYVTHVLAVDERDANDINAQGLAPAIWWPAAVPGRFICERDSSAPKNHAVFSGAIYGKRANWLELAELKGLLAQLPSPEEGTIYPALFDLLHVAVRLFLRDPAQEYNLTHLIYAYSLRLTRRLVTPQYASAVYLYLLRLIRRHCFDLWLRQLQTGCAVVNLPSFVKSYPGRVVEGMAASRPVISWEIPDRPRNKALFENGVEIMLYKQDDPSQLVAHVQRLSADPKLGQRIALNATRKLKRLHTMEKRVHQIFNWVETGEPPTYV